MASEAAGEGGASVLSPDACAGYTDKTMWSSGTMSDWLEQCQRACTGVDYPMSVGI